MISARLKKIQDFVVANWMLICAVLLFIGLLLVIYFSFFHEILTRPKENRAFGDIAVSKDDEFNKIDTSSTKIYMSKTANIVEWDKVNPVYELKDWTQNVEMNEVVARLAPDMELSPNENFQIWIGKSGEVAIYNENVEFNLTDSNISVGISDMSDVSSSKLNDKVKTMLSDLLGIDTFDDFDFTQDSDMPTFVVGTLSINDDLVTMYNWSNDMIVLNFSDDGTLIYAYISRYVHNTATIGRYASYDSNQIVQELEEGDPNEKIIRVRILWGNTGESEIDPTYGENPYQSQVINFSELDINYLTINAMTQIYFLDSEGMKLIPVVALKATTGISETKTFAEGTYELEIWWQNIN